MLSSIDKTSWLELINAVTVSPFKSPIRSILLFDIEAYILKDKPSISTIEYTAPSLILNTLPLKELSADDFISKLLTKLSISGLLSIIESTFSKVSVYLSYLSINSKPASVILLPPPSLPPLVLITRV